MEFKPGHAFGTPSEEWVVIVEDLDEQYIVHTVSDETVMREELHESDLREKVSDHWGAELEERGILRSDGYVLHEGGTAPKDEVENIYYEVVGNKEDE